MASVDDHLDKLRAERNAREKARIERLRQINLKKYSKEETWLPKTASSVSVLKSAEVKKSEIVKRLPLSHPKNNFHVNNTSKRPITAPALNVANKNPLNPVELKKTVNTTLLKQKTDVKKNLKPLYEARIAVEKSKSAENVAKKLLKTHQQATPIGDFKKPTPVVTVLHGPHLSKNPKGDNSTYAKAGPSKYPKLSRQSLIPRLSPQKSKVPTKPKELKKSVQPRATQSSSNIYSNRQTVFERLYQPKHVTQNKNVTDAEKIRNNPTFLLKNIKNTNLIMNKRHTVFEAKTADKPTHLPRRSISAVHFKRLSKNELPNCIHKWASIGEKIDKVHLKDISEDAAVKEDKIVSAIKSECKKVTFQTPIYNFNTPRPEELRERLHNWLKKRGKSIDSYHHIQCFGIRNLSQPSFKPVNLETSRFEEFDDEDKENQPLDSDTDNESYEENMNNKETAKSKDKNEELASQVHLTADVNCYSEINKEIRANEKKAEESNEKVEESSEKDYILSDSDVDVAKNKWYEASDKEAKTQDDNEQQAAKVHLTTDVRCYSEAATDKWRRASYMSDCVTDMNDTRESMATPSATPHVNDLLSGALTDLTELIKEGFDWQQCARWLRAVREHYPHAPNTALYWECRAVLEEKQDNLPASVYCWEQAIAKGTEHSVVEASLEQLLDKFMQLKISPKSSAKREPNPGLVDLKNVFKSTVIRFAVQQAKIKSQEPKFTVTPVRRSARISSRWSEKRTPLQDCTSIRQASQLFPHPVFVPNDKLTGTP